MGLLTQILGNVLGSGGRSPLGRSSSGGSSRILMALLPIVLSMLANRRSSGQSGQVDAGGAYGSGHGGGDVLGGVLGGLGGLGGLLERFTRGGFGSQAQSWIGTGPNEPLSQDAMSAVFEPSQLAEIATRAGITEDEARSGLSELIPEIVDHFTPDGQLPADAQLSSSIDEFARQLERN